MLCSDGLSSANYADLQNDRSYESRTQFVTHAAASEECTKEKSEDDRAFIESAISAGTLAKGPKGLRDSMLIQDGFWFDMNYLEQIVFMQRFECAASAGSGKKLLYMDVRSLGTGRLLATWTLGVLKPGEGHPATNYPEMSDGIEDNNPIGLTGEARAAFIKSAIDECNKKTTSSTYCSCYANAIADSVSVKELMEGMAALRPKADAAAKSCRD